MRLLKSVILLAALTVLCGGCYTTLRLPNRSMNDQQEEELSWQRPQRDPAVPAAHAEDLDWLFYYQLPWWHDEAELYYEREPGRPYVPEEFRQRYPQDPGYSGNYSGSYSPTVTAPSLGKQAADSSQSPQTEEPKDTRRTFGQGAASTPAASSPAPSAGSRETRTPSGSTEDRQQPKRR
jgi:hypothetical protein